MATSIRKTLWYIKLHRECNEIEWPERERATIDENGKKVPWDPKGTDRKYFPNYINISYINYIMKIRIVIILSNKFPSFIFAGILHSFIFSSNVQKIIIVIYFLL